MFRAALACKQGLSNVKQIGNQGVMKVFLRFGCTTRFEIQQLQADVVLEVFKNMTILCL
jgi:hypothetical protein